MVVCRGVVVDKQKRVWPAGHGCEKVSGAPSQPGMGGLEAVPLAHPSPLPTSAVKLPEAIRYLSGKKLTEVPCEYFQRCPEMWEKVRQAKDGSERNKALKIAAKGYMLTEIKNSLTKTKEPKLATHGPGQHDASPTPLRLVGNQLRLAPVMMTKQAAKREPIGLFRQANSSGETIRLGLGGNRGEPKSGADQCRIVDLSDEDTECHPAPDLAQADAHGSGSLAPYSGKKIRCYQRSTEKSLEDVLKCENKMVLDDSRGGVVPNEVLPQDFLDEVNGLLPQGDDQGHQLVPQGVKICCIICRANGTFSGGKRFMERDLYLLRQEGKSPTLSGDPDPRKSSSSREDLCELMGIPRVAKKEIYVTAVSFRTSRACLLIPDDHPHREALVGSLDLERYGKQGYALVTNLKLKGNGATWSTLLFKVLFHNCHDVCAKAKEEGWLSPKRKIRDGEAGSHTTHGDSGTNHHPDDAGPLAGGEDLPFLRQEVTVPALEEGELLAEPSFRIGSQQLQADGGNQNVEQPPQKKLRQQGDGTDALPTEKQQTSSPVARKNIPWPEVKTLDPKEAKEAHSKDANGLLPVSGEGSVSRTSGQETQEVHQREPLFAFPSLSNPRAQVAIVRDNPMTGPGERKSGATWGPQGTPHNPHLHSHSNPIPDPRQHLRPPADWKTEDRLRRERNEAKADVETLRMSLSKELDKVTSIGKQVEQLQEEAISKDNEIKQLREELENARQDARNERGRAEEELCKKDDQLNRALRDKTRAEDETRSLKRGLQDLLHRQGPGNDRVPADRDGRRPLRPTRRRDHTTPRREY